MLYAGLDLDATLQRKHRTRSPSSSQRDPEVSPRMNEGRPVFRVREGSSRKVPAIYFGLLLGVFVGFILLASTEKPWWFAVTIPLGIAVMLNRLPDRLPP